jgi:Domain of unknown function (DUF6983)
MADQMNLNIEHIEFKKQEIPVSKMIDIDGRLYSIEIQYNEVHDFYVAILYDDNEKPMISSKLVYLGNAFHACCEHMPEKKLIPLNINDLSSEQPGKNLRLSAEMFEDRIKIYIL